MKRDRDSSDEPTVKRVKITISKFVKTLLPRQISPETLAAPSTEWKSRPSFESVLTTYSSYELDGAAEGKSIEQAFASGMGFLRKFADSKRRERESKQKAEEWKKKEEEWKKKEEEWKAKEVGYKNGLKKQQDTLQESVPPSLQFRILIDAWLVHKLADFDTQKIEAFMHANDEWERMGTDKYAVVAVFGEISKQGGHFAHKTKAGFIAEALLSEDGPQGEKLNILSTMLQDLTGFTAAEILDSKKLRTLVINGTSKSLLNLMIQRDAKVAQINAEGIALKEKQRILSECNTDASLLKLLSNEVELLFHDTSLLSDDSSNREEQTSDSDLESENSSVEGGFW